MFVAALNLLPFLFCLDSGVSGSNFRDKEIVVSAAASLSDCFRLIGSDFEKTHPTVKVKFNFGSSGSLKKQILSGAPADVFASASELEVDELVKQRQMDSKTVTHFASNKLVFIAPPHSKIKRISDCNSPLVQKLALSDPDAVPSGRYTRQTLISRKIWDQVQSKLIKGRDVRQTLTYVVNGDVDAGFVFATDAKEARNKVLMVETAIPGKDHEPISYVAIAANGSQEGRQFVEYLTQKRAHDILSSHGFLPPNTSHSGKH